MPHKFFIRVVSLDGILCRSTIWPVKFARTNLARCAFKDCAYSTQNHGEQLCGPCLFLGSTQHQSGSMEPGCGVSEGISTVEEQT